MKVSKVVKTAVKLAPFVIPIVRKAMDMKKEKTPMTSNTSKK